MTKRRRKSKRAPDARGMRGWRSRVKSSGRLRKKRSDTTLAALEKTYRTKSVKKLVK